VAKPKAMTVMTVNIPPHRPLKSEKLICKPECYGK
jgi:hypothetical protein